MSTKLKKTTKKKNTNLSIEDKIKRFEKLFPTPEITRHLLLVAEDLAKSGYGMRKGESDVSYLFRINYCVECNIPLCFLNLTYNIDGKVSRMVELKGILFKKQFPDSKVEVIISTPEKCIVRGRVSPEGNWVKVEYDIEKAKKLDTYKHHNKHWVHNPQRMLNKTCKGDLYDYLSETPMSENLIVEDEK